MTPQAAQKQAEKRWGKKAFVRMNDALSSPERREKARVTVRETRAEIDKINAEIRERLEALDWYQELTARRKKLTNTVRQTEGSAFYYKFHVGSAGEMFATIHGSGDTFEQAFAQADGKDKSI